MTNYLTHQFNPTSNQSANNPAVAITTVQGQYTLPSQPQQLYIVQNQPTGTSLNGQPIVFSTQPSRVHSSTGGVVVSNSAGAAVGSLTTSPSTNPSLNKLKNYFENVLNSVKRDSVQDLADVQKLILGLLEGSHTVDDYMTRLIKILRSNIDMTPTTEFLRKNIQAFQQYWSKGLVVIKGLDDPFLNGGVDGPSSVGFKKEPLTSSEFGGPANVASSVISHPAVSSVGPGRPISSKPTPIFIKPSTGHSSNVHGLSAIFAPGTTTSTPGFAPSVPATLGTGAGRPSRPAVGTLAGDELNDVATMGGVDLKEESRNIYLAPSSASVRRSSSLSQSVVPSADSTVDQPVVDVELVRSMFKLPRIQQYGLDEISPDALRLVSFGVQDRLQSLLAQMSLASEHRTRQYRRNEQWLDPVRDVRNNLRCLDTLDRNEKRKREKRETDDLVKAAKSSRRQDTDERELVRQRARERQQSEIAEARLNEANQAALSAIEGGSSGGVFRSFGAPSVTSFGLDSSTVVSTSFDRNVVPTSAVGLNVLSGGRTSPSLSSRSVEATDSSAYSGHRRVTLKDLQFVVCRDKYLKNSQLVGKLLANPSSLSAARSSTHR